MNRHTGILLGSIVLSYGITSFLLESGVNVSVLHCFLTIFIGRIISAVIKNFLPIQLLPELHKKAVLISGCDSGFGHLCAQRMDSLGLEVYAGCLFPEDSGAKTLKERCSGRLHIVKLDITDDEQVQAAAEYVKDSLGDKVLWAVVNNAGIATTGELEWHPIETIRKIFDVNVLGHIRVTKAFLPLLRKSKGRVVNVVSFVGHVTLPWAIPYCASKAAFNAVTNGLRLELKKFSISVHSINPFIYTTPMQNALSTVIWEECPSHVKDVYAKDYYSDIVKSAKFLMFKCFGSSPQLWKVVNGIVDAAVGAHPQDSYAPSMMDKVMLAIITYSPAFIKNAILQFLTWYMTPKFTPQ